ncbi:hypothetical protein SLE2022_154550 [Rubroshorea leprosula]
MFLPPQPKSLLRFFISFPPTYIKCLCTSAAKTPLPLNRLHALCSTEDSDKVPNCELVLVSALKSCASRLAIAQGRQIHCLVLKTGFNSNTFVQNSLINMYVKCGLIGDAKSLFDSCVNLDSVSWNIMIIGFVKLGRFDDARHLFEVMPVKDCVSYTTMIMGFSKNGCWKEAVGVFKDMRCVGVMPNKVTLVNLISASSHLGGIWGCRMLHALVVKLHLDRFVLVSTNLLHNYCVCSSLRDARYLFDAMAERNVVSWNVMLNGYSKAGLIELARDLFERLPAKDVVSWGTMINGYLQVNRLSEALAMYRAMLCDGLGPTDVMVVDLMSACTRERATTEGFQLHGAIVKAGFDCYEFVQATIIHFYAYCGRIDLACLQFELGIKDHLASRNALIAAFIRNGMIEQARQIFNEMPERDVYSWSSIISGYTQNEQPHLALELFHGMITSGMKPNQTTLASVFSAIACLGALNEGRWLHEYVFNNCISLSDNLSAAIIDMYAKCGSINTALEMFYEIRDKTSTVSPWNAVICGLAMHGRTNLSLEIYSDLERRPHIKQNPVTFIGVLTACCHAGLVDLGKRYFKRMISVYNIDPGIKHYGCMINLLGRAGRLEEAEEMIGSMPMKADVVIWGTLLAACRTHGNVKIAEKAAENLARLEPSHEGGRVLLSNIYADAGRWDDVLSIRTAMQGERINKSYGYSGIV